ncbi:ATP-dependent DNA helicase PIF1 [Cyphomyrmex costatus]|uniref:ATP-dependent DNA helicase n=1 Tax=Cyphomyrmex costatus TaxID=456900 RepID=A0A151I7Q7_9HYME|nr:ATP-dependent DNA helicase PIF1 [Cyphomyrmex costatus]
MISKLNADQRRGFNRVTDTISSDKKILRLYVSGEGGTGKSSLIQIIKCWIKQNLNKDTAITAPTGMAACNVNGLTAHRLFQLPVEHGRTPKYKPLADHVLKILRTDLKDVSLIVIDKVSMISNIFFMYINLRLCEIYNTTDCDDGWKLGQQFPLSLSYGITIHKSQGLSFQYALMDLGNNVFSCGQIYVALSRVTCLDGLHLINFDPSSVFTSEKAIIEYNRL